MRISDWSSDVCSSDLRADALDGSRSAPEDLPQAGLNEFAVLRDAVGRCVMLVGPRRQLRRNRDQLVIDAVQRIESTESREDFGIRMPGRRSEEHTSELQSLMRISYAVFCLKKTKTSTSTPHSLHKYI